ncbi:hypothetical protein D1007_42263 [Hordeum vulgare]|nr:hypothetical protein D1007_42263 [Hordeum vulgare]
MTLTTKAEARVRRRAAPRGLDVSSRGSRGRTSTTWTRSPSPPRVAAARHPTPPHAEAGHKSSGRPPPPPSPPSTTHLSDLAGLLPPSPVCIIGPSTSRIAASSAQPRRPPTILLHVASRVAGEQFNWCVHVVACVCSCVRACARWFN